MLYALISIISYLTYILVGIVLVQFILGILIAFNVVSASNHYVSSIYDSLNKLLAPILRPIQRLMPDTGMIDFSPMVLIIGLNILVRLLQGLYLESFRFGM
jgi:YggT family protein